MTLDQFQDRYHSYGEPDRKKAVEEARKVNSVSLGFTCSAVHFPEQNAWALMCDTAIQGLKDMGMVLDTAR